MKLSLFLLFLFLSAQLYSAEITFIKSDGAEKRFSIEELKKKVTSEKIRVFNFKSRVFEEYNAFSVRELLPYVSGQKGIPGDLFLTSINGYKPFIKRQHLLSESGYFAYERIGGKMNTIDHKTGDLVTTSPLYLVWLSQKERDKQKGLRWVYQIESLTYNVADIFKEDLPSHLPRAIHEGAIIYQTHCMRCHRESGVAKDLVTPSILHRLDPKQISKYIYDPKSVNPKSKMPGFEHILQDESDVDFIIQYLNYQKNPNSAQFQRRKSQELNKALDQVNN